MATTIHSKLWAGTVAMTTAMTVTGTMKYTASLCTITSGYAGLMLSASCMFTGSATLDLEIYVYGSLDGAKYDDTALTAMNVEYGNAISKQNSMIMGNVPPYIKVGAKVASTTQQASVSITARPWRWKSV